MEGTAGGGCVPQRRGPTAVDARRGPACAEEGSGGRDKRWSCLRQPAVVAHRCLARVTPAMGGPRTLTLGCGTMLENEQLKCIPCPMGLITTYTIYKEHPILLTKYIRCIYI